MDKHIIVVGLCGSGKSHLLKEYSKTHAIHDDFVSNFCSGKLISDLNLGKRVCVADPRLCDYNIFEDYILGVFDMSEVHIILFENDTEKCVNNIGERKNPSWWVSTILKLSKLYDLSNYSQYDITIRKVYLNVLL